MEQKTIERYLEAPAAFERAGIRIEVRDQVSSTNDLLKQAAAGGEPEGKVLIALEQTLGKGRLGRRFFSPRESGIYLSVLLRPKISPEDSLLLTTAAAVAAAGAIGRIGGEDVGIKWVNDIWCRGKKVAGILAESGFAPSEADEAPRLQYVVVGIGFNLWEPEGGFPEELREIAGAVFPYEKRPGSFEEREEIRERLAAAFLEEYFRIYEELPARNFMETYRRLSVLTGRKVFLRTPGHEALSEDPVLVRGIGDSGELIVEENGQIRALSQGEVSVSEQHIS